MENGEPVEYGRGQHVVWRKEQSDWVFFLAEGLVRVSFSFPDKTDRIIGYFVPGAAFAQSGSFMEDYDGMLSYTSETASKILRMKRKRFLACLKSDSRLMSEYLGMTLRNQILLIDRIVYQGEKGLYGKCARWLLFMAKYYGKEDGSRCTIAVPLTQDTIADFLHATRESVNATLQRLIKEKHIAIVRKKISILNCGKLRKLLD